MKIVLLFSSLFLSTSVFAQTVTCQPHGEGLYKKLEIKKPELNFEVPWFSVRLDNKFNQRKVFTVEPVLRGPNLSFISQSGRSEFALNIENYNGPGTYHSAQLILNQGSPTEEKADLMCEVPGDIVLVNACGFQDQKQVLFQAAKNRNFIEVESALECGAGGNAKNEFGCTALLLTADPFCGQVLPSPITYNPIAQSLPIVDLLTNNGAIVDAKDPVSSETALHKFVKLGDFDTVSLLLDLEAEVDPQDNRGFTPLMRAVEKNDKYLVQRVVEAGPDLNLKNKDGETALVIAQKLGFKKLEMLLQEPSATIEIAGSDDGLCTPQVIQLAVNKVSKIVLNATSGKMFLMTAPGLGINLMAGAGSSVSQNIVPPKSGTFEFTCGVHGANKQTNGQITVQ